jgi:hypothetical protein
MSVVLVVDDVLVCAVLVEVAEVVVVVAASMVVVVVAGTHVSTPSQVPPVQGVPESWNVHVVVQQELAVPLAAPSSHCSPDSMIPFPQIGLNVTTPVPPVNVLTGK